MYAHVENLSSSPYAAEGTVLGFDQSHKLFEGRGFEIQVGSVNHLCIDEDVLGFELRHTSRRAFEHYTAWILLIGISTPAT
jgi:hypothetical protein